MMERIKDIVRSQKFFVATLILFTLQGLLFTVVVNPSLEVGDTPSERSGGVVPDGNRHLATIYYFAEQPIQNGPFIHNMSDDDLTLGDLERFPSYLYYYVMSLFTRIALVAGLSDYGIVMMIRLIGLAMGIFVLVLFRRIVRLAGTGNAIANVATLGVAMTGAFAYLAPAENYDVTALLFWMLFLLASMKLIVKKEATQLYWMAVWFFVGSITKYTYLPFMGLGGLIAVFIYVRSIGLSLARDEVLRQFKQKIATTTKLQLSVLGVLLVVAVALFAERIGTNLMQYRSVSPSCAVIHSDESCRNYSIYQRNVTRAEQVEAGTTWTKEYHFIEYTFAWLARYYVSLYVYFGHIWIYDVSKLLIISVVLVGVMLFSAIVYLVKKRRKPQLNIAVKYLLVMTAVVIIAQYTFNTRTYLWSGGEMYAHQGRYLLSVIGFVYVALLVLCRDAYMAVVRKKQPYVLGVIISVGVIALLANGAVLNLFIHANSPDWYSEIGKQIVPSSWYDR